MNRKIDSYLIGVFAGLELTAYCLLLYVVGHILGLHV